MTEKSDKPFHGLLHPTMGSPALLAKPRLQGNTIHTAWMKKFVEIYLGSLHPQALLGILSESQDFFFI